MTKKVISLITVIALTFVMLSVASFGAFNGYALRFNEQSTLDKLALTNTEVTLQDGYTTFSSTAHDPNATYKFGETELDADTYKFMVIRYKTNSDHKPEETIGEMYFESESASYGGTTRITWGLNRENTWTNVIFDLSGNADWKGNIKSFRIDYIEGPTLPAGQKMDIECIAVFATKAEAEAFNGFASENPATGDASVAFVVIAFIALGAVVLKKRLAY